MQVDVRARAEVRLEGAVDLNGVNMQDTLGEELREDAEPGADFEDDVARHELGQPLDHPQDVVVDEEVLPERLLGRDAHTPKAAVAFVSISAARSAASSPRAAARAPTV